jgi:acetoin utilization deacetylase AcuC-like enzyme
MSSMHNNNRVKLYYNDVYEVPLPPKHRFPMKKYKAVRYSIMQDALPNVDLAVSPQISTEDLSTAHCPLYIGRYLGNKFTADENRRVGFPWSMASVRRSLSSVGGTVAAMHAVMGPEGYRIAGHLAGGTHHAFRDRGEGFCVFNDIATAATVALRDLSLERILIIDLDVHQGNGTAKIFENDSRVTTFSMHCGKNLFSKREASDLDVELEVGIGDEEFLELTALHVQRLMETIQPQLTFYQAGVDPSKQDALGKLALSREGLMERNRIVCEASLRASSPLVVTMGGGYPKDLDSHSDPFKAVVDAHTDVYRAAAGAAGRTGA